MLTKGCGGWGAEGAESAWGAEGWGAEGWGVVGAKVWSVEGVEGAEVAEGRVWRVKRGGV